MLGSAASHLQPKICWQIKYIFWEKDQGHMLSCLCVCVCVCVGCIDDVLGGCGFINGQQVPVNDDNSHGTHVAGSIGATKNGAGVLGVAQKVSLMSCKFLDADGNGFNSDAIACINYCAANFKRMGQKVPIYSNSWGCLNCYDPTVYNAIANTAGQLPSRFVGVDNTPIPLLSPTIYPPSQSGVVSLALCSGPD